jgi:UDP:flavonoid glycosyltransferase YjiC (YdhE family)
MARPLIFAYHARPLNRVRRSRGLPSLGSDLRRTYTDADWVFYADPPELVPIDRLPPNHQYLGPVLWSPDVELPAWWEELPQDKPVIYVTMGSSGSGVDLVTALEALEAIGCTAIVATAGDPLAHVASTPKFAAKYLPGELAARRARLVLCNGGAPTCHQALAAGVPVLGIARNLDQHLNMRAVERAGVGMLLRSDACSAAAIRGAVQHLLATPSFSERAARMSDAFRRYDAPSAFAAATARILGREGRGE